MRIDLIPVGANPPHSLNVIIEVPTGGEPVKYEFDKASGALFVDLACCDISIGLLDLYGDAVLFGGGNPLVHVVWLRRRQHRILACCREIAGHLADNRLQGMLLDLKIALSGNLLR